MYKTFTTALRARELPLWWLAPPPCPVGSMSYDTESKSRNASCVPFRGRGPRSGEGVDGGKNDYDILILCLIVLKGKRLITFSRRSAQGAADWRSGPRWSILSVLCPVHPFPLRGTSPRWEACHWIFRSLRSLTNPVPLPPQGETRK